MAQGFNLESTDQEYIGQMRAISDYAAGKGIEMGGYDLLADTRGRGHDPTVECIKCLTNETDGKTTCAPDGSTCLASQGSDAIFANIIGFVNKTNWGSVETDGPYEGESCASTNHSHHVNLADSVYNNWKRNMEFYHQLQSTGVYINAPDPCESVSYYFVPFVLLMTAIYVRLTRMIVYTTFLQTSWTGRTRTGWGTTKSSGASLGGSGSCRPDNRSTTRPSTRSRRWVCSENQAWGTSSCVCHLTDVPYFVCALDCHAGWQFCPIEPYNGGPASILEPIAEHLKEYEFVLSSYLGTGTQAAYRGTRLFDPASPASQALVTKWVKWFKQHRAILNSDIVHVKRPDLAGFDSMLHVNSNTTRCDEPGRYYHLLKPFLLVIGICHRNQSGSRE
jgi:hypothetical protein